jgi:hypothetical protein
MTDGLTRSQQDLDAEEVKERFRHEYQQIQTWLSDGWSVKAIDRRIGDWFSGWHLREHYQQLCRNAARSLARTREAEGAPRCCCLEYAGDNPGCKVHTYLGKE